MREKLRCGVIGSGAIGLDHLTSLASCPWAATVAIAEKNPQRQRQMADKFGVSRSYTDYHELLDQPDIDAVTIALPNCLHAPVALEALQARKHVLLEKPFAMNAKEAAKVAAVAQKVQRTVMVAQSLRFDPQTHTARACVQRGELGEVYHARAWWRRWAGIPRIGSWFTQKAQSGGGCMIDLGVHVLDTCLHLMGEFEAVAVTAQTHAKFGPRGTGEMDWGKSEVSPTKPFDVEDYGVALIKLKSGRTVLLETSWAAFHPDDGRERGLDLLGTNGGLSLYPARLHRNGPLGQETIQLAPTKAASPEDRIHHFVDCVLHGTKPLVPLPESLAVQGILDAIQTSAKTGKEVRLR